MNPLQWLADILRAIWCAILTLPQFILDGLVAVVNLAIVALGYAAEQAVGALPTMPEAPGPPSSGIVAALNWFFPLAVIVSALAGITALWVAVLAARQALKWVKAL